MTGNLFPAARHAIGSQGCQAIDHSAGKRGYADESKPGADNAPYRGTPFINLPMVIPCQMPIGNLGTRLTCICGDSRQHSGGSTNRENRQRDQRIMKKPITSAVAPDAAEEGQNRPCSSAIGKDNAVNRDADIGRDGGGMRGELRLTHLPNLEIHVFADFDHG